MSLGGSPQSFQANARIDLGNRPEDWKKNEWFQSGSWFCGRDL
jgi:hypothetical protein